MPFTIVLSASGASETIDNLYTGPRACHRMKYISSQRAKYNCHVLQAACLCLTAIHDRFYTKHENELEQDDSSVGAHYSAPNMKTSRESS